MTSGRRRHLEVVNAAAVGAALGESPLWSSRDHSLYWIDITARTLNRFDPATGDNVRWDTASMPGCIMLAEGGDLIVVAQDGVYRWRSSDGAFEMIHDVPYNTARYRFNDGKTDRVGRRLWVGCMPLDPSDATYLGTGITYSYDGTVMKPVLAPITSANGIAFSPDAATMYRSETRRQQILAYDHDPETGTLSNERLFAEVPPELGLPDGATVDSEGGYWTALPVGSEFGSVARFTPTGDLDFYIETPVRIPTMVSFGGEDMSTLYVTSAKLEGAYGLAARPDSGDLFCIETDFCGITEAPFATPWTTHTVDKGETLDI